MFLYLVTFKTSIQAYNSAPFFGQCRCDSRVQGYGALKLLKFMAYVIRFQSLYIISGMSMRKSPSGYITGRPVVYPVVWLHNRSIAGYSYGTYTNMSRPDFKQLARLKAGQPILKRASWKIKVIHESTNLSILVSICDNYHALEVSSALNRAAWGPIQNRPAHGPHASIKA